MNRDRLARSRRGWRYPCVLGVAAALILCFGCGGSSNRNSANGSNFNGNPVGASTGTNSGNGSGSPYVPTGPPLANVILPTGTWGGEQNKDGPLVPGSLQVSSSGGQLTLFCGASAQYVGPLVLDGAGSFVIQGTGHLLTGSQNSADSGTVVFSGTVTVETVNGQRLPILLLTVSDPVASINEGTFVLVLGQSALPYEGTCP